MEEQMVASTEAWMVVAMIALHCFDFWVMSASKMADWPEGMAAVMMAMNAVDSVAVRAVHSVAVMHLCCDFVVPVKRAAAVHSRAPMKSPSSMYDSPGPTASREPDGARAMVWEEVAVVAVEGPSA